MLILYSDESKSWKVRYSPELIFIFILLIYNAAILQKSTLIRTVHKSFSCSIEANYWECCFVQNLTLRIELLSEIELVSRDYNVEKLIVSILSVVKSNFHIVFVIFSASIIHRADLQLSILLVYHIGPAHWLTPLAFERNMVKQR